MKSPSTADIVAENPMVEGVELGSPRRAPLAFPQHRNRYLFSLSQEELVVGTYVRRPILF
jgi:hypothetical protein